MTTATATTPWSAPAARTDVPVRPSRLPVLWVAYGILCQVALLPGALAPLRFWFRAASFAGSLALFFLLPRRRSRHPASPYVIAALLLLLVEIFHPNTNSIGAGVAHAGLYLAIMGPLLWGTRTDVDLKEFERALLLLWLFQTCSAAVGVLQVYFPGQFQPNLSSVIVAQGRSYLQGLYITTASGARVLRPMGLTDTPGGAAAAGFYAVALGFGFLLRTRQPWKMALFGLGMLMGVTVLYLAQVRALFVAAVVVLVGLTAAQLFSRRRKARSARVLLLGLVAMAAGFAIAVNVGGRQVVIGRLGRLLEGNAADVYHSNRGFYFTELRELIPTYPVGAGLGRWGMVQNYFAARNGDPGLWVELQWTAWLVDGGIPLMILYATALLTAVLTAWQIARRARGTDREAVSIWALVVLALSLGVIALTFDSSPFIGELGTSFWFLNAALFALARHARQDAAVTE